MNTRKHSKTKKQATRSRARAAAPTVPPIVAMELAKAFLSGDPDPVRSQEVIGTALCVGEWLAANGRPGRWDTLDIPALIQWAAPPTDFDREGLLLNLAALIGFAGMNEAIPNDTARTYLRQIANLSEQPAIRTLAEQGHAALQITLN